MLSELLIVGKKRFSEHFFKELDYREHVVVDSKHKETAVDIDIDDSVYHFQFKSITYLQKKPQGEGMGHH